MIGNTTASTRTNVSDPIRALRNKNDLFRILLDYATPKQTFDFLYKRGGTAISVPKNMARSQKGKRTVLEKELGRYCAERIVADFGGMILIVPLCRAYLVRYLLLDGFSATETARSLHITRSTVYKIGKSFGLCPQNATMETSKKAKP